MPDIRPWFRFRLRTLLLITSLVCICIAFFPKLHRFTDLGATGAVELVGTSEFLGHELIVYVTPDSKRKWPSIRQRLLINRVEGYEHSLWDEIKDVAIQNLHAFEDDVGDMTDEYGMPEMNRENIEDFFAIDAIWIPRQADSSDDYVGIMFGCDWETELGMYMLLRNGKIVWHGWSYSQWYRQSGLEQMNDPKDYGIKLK